MNILAKAQLKILEPDIEFEEYEQRQKDFLSLYYQLREKEESRWYSRLTLRQRKSLHGLILFVYRVKNRLDGFSYEIIKNQCGKTERPIIFAVTHVGKFDIEVISEAIRSHYYLLSGDFEHIQGIIDAPFLGLNGVIYFNEQVKQDRRLASERMVRLLRSGGNLMYFPEGTWNLTPNLPVLPCYWGIISIARQGGAIIVPIAAEQYGRHFKINIGENFDVSAYGIEDAEKARAIGDLRDMMAALKYEIWETVSMQRKALGTTEWDEYVAERFREWPYFNSSYISRLIYRPKGITTYAEAFAHLNRLRPSKANAFLLRKRHGGIFMTTEQKLTGYPSIDKPWLKYYSEEAINAKLPECTIYDYLYSSNKDYTGRTALNYFGRKISYGQLFENIEKAAFALRQNGIGKGSIVTILMPTLPETVYLFYALSKIGAIGNMVDPRTSPEGICNYIQEVESELLIVVDVALPKVDEILNKTAVKKVLVISPADSLPPVLGTLYKIRQKKRSKFDGKYINWKNFIAEGANCTGAASVDYERNRAVVIVHTGGTTGRPKGVLLTNENLNASAFQCQISGIDMQREHSWLNIMPPFIAYGVGNGLHLPLAIGMETILIPQFDPDKFDELLLKYRPNHMTGVPSHYGSIIISRRMKNEDLSYVIAPTVGGDTMDIGLEEQTNRFLKEHNCKYMVTKGYGMTEVAAGVTVCISNECNRIGSVGIPLTHTVVSIFNPETGEELSYNQQGEVCITGPNTMLGYYKNPEATSEIIIRHKDGLDWVHSGDIGYMTEDGMLFIVDRIKRMIVRHDGFKVFPSLIEKSIVSHEAVKACCVVGIPDKEHSQGKLPAAHIVLTPEFAEREEFVRKELAVLCLRELPEYAQPVDYVFHDSLPLTPIGKVDYRALEEK